MKGKSNKIKIVFLINAVLIVCASLFMSQLVGAAVKAQMTFYNFSNDPAMISLSPSTSNCIVQAHQSCPLQTELQYYTVNVCVTYCAQDNLFLYTEYSVYGTCDVYLNQTTPTNFTVSNACPDKDKDKQNPAVQTLVLQHPASNKTNTKPSAEPSCGIQCKVEVNESLNNARAELQKGNTSGIISHLDAAQRTLNSTDSKD